MKKIISSVVIVLTAVVMNCMVAFAADPSVMAVPEAVGVAGALYDFFVTTEMAGRSGLTQTGAKGIALEAEAMNKMNFQSLFQGVSTQMSESAIDPAYDLITTAKDGSMVKGIQCKAGVSDTNVTETVKRIVDGYYPEGTEFLGTTESSELVNKALEDAGSDIRMKDSGISDKRVNDLANKALGNPTSAAKMLSNAGKSSAIFAVFNMGVAGLESYMNGDSASETVSNVTISGAEGALAGALTSLAADGAANMMIMVGAGSVATGIVPIVVGVEKTLVVMYVLDDVVEENNLKAVVADAAAKAGVAIKKTAITAKDKTVELATKAGEGISTAASSVKTGFNKAGEAISSTAKSAGSFVKNTFEGTKGKITVAANN